MTHRIWHTSLIFFLILIPASALFAQSTTDYLVNWVPNPEATVAGYVIYRSTQSDQNFTAIDSVNANTFAYLDQGRPKGIRYYYRIVAKDNYGNRSPFSNPVSGMTIAQDAEETQNNLCKVDDIERNTDGSYNVTWSSVASTIGFVQYDDDASLDSMTTWDDDEYSTLHSNQMIDLIAPNTYYLRAVSYDGTDNMTISAIDTLAVTGENPAPLSAPQLRIFPIPYHPGMGALQMANLPAGGAVTVFNGSGLEVWRTNVGAGTSLTWNGLNAQGEPVMSGVYYVMVRDADGTVLDRRPVMIVN